MLGLPRELLADIDAATVTDRNLYKIAVSQFFQEAHYMEHQLRRRVVCDSILTQWEPELAYLNVSVIDLYYKNATR